MKNKKILIAITLFLVLIAYLSFISRDPNKSTFSSTEGYQHKEFGSSSSLDGKPLILNNTETYEFQVKSKIKEGYLSVTLLNKERDKEFLKIEGSNIDEKKEITLEAGEYAVEIETHDAKDGEFTLKYNKKIKASVN